MSVPIDFGAMPDTERLWLARREYGDESLVELVYASPDGSRRLIKHLSAHLLRSTTVTAAIDADPEAAEPVGSEALRREYAAEIDRLRETHDPDDPV